MSVSYISCLLITIYFTFFGGGIKDYT